MIYKLFVDGHLTDLYSTFINFEDESHHVNEKELVLKGKDAKKFLDSFSKPLSVKEKKKIDEAEALYKKHCVL